MERVCGVVLESVDLVMIYVDTAMLQSQLGPKNASQFRYPPCSGRMFQRLFPNLPLSRPKHIITFKVTDSEQRRVVEIPNELALSVGIFKDMI